jgi:hypothetical protein
MKQIQIESSVGKFLAEEGAAYKLYQKAGGNMSVGSRIEHAEIRPLVGRCRGRAPESPEASPEGHQVRVKTKVTYQSRCLFISSSLLNILLVESTDPYL